MTRHLRIIRDIAVFALAFQLVHFIEHIAQLAYWFSHPSEAPWLTPWAASGRNLLAVGGSAGAGNELLHLVGNAIFFGGIIALVFLATTTALRMRDVSHLRGAVVVQGVHLVEHIALTTTYLAAGSAMGLSTLFGAADGAFGIGLRVWAHFLLNLVATYYALRATWTLYRVGLIIPTPASRHLEPAA